VTYNVKLEGPATNYCRTMMSHPYMAEWIAAAKLEPDELEELDVEF
jgi:glutathione S-transferase